MEILSLNDAYQFNAMHYWCNAAGEINLPGDGILWPRNAGSMICHSEEDLPPKAKELYECFWSDGWAAKEYVVQFSGRTGFAFNFLFDEEWMNNLKIPAPLFRKIASYVISEKLNNPLFENCAVLYGEETDPDGDELLIVVPYESYALIPDMRIFFDEHDLWKAIEHAVKCLS